MNLDWPNIRWFKRSDPITFGRVADLVEENATLRSRVETLLSANNQLVNELRAERRETESIRERLYGLALGSWEQNCLIVDPFEGDFGDSGDTILKDEIVRAGKHHFHACHCCGGDIPMGQRHRVRAEKVDGEFMSFRWCYECCRAMVLSQWDGGDLWESRIGCNRV